jgi:hypothetical protein
MSLMARPFNSPCPCIGRKRPDRSTENADGDRAEREPVDLCSTKNQCARSSRPESRLTLIAVVDDDASIRSATASLLRSRGYAVSTFASAEAFLQLGELNGTACVITDVAMPVISGVELQAINGGTTCFLTKPFDAPTLIKYLEIALAPMP